jgi:hypothetical protein
MNDRRAGDGTMTIEIWKKVGFLPVAAAAHGVSRSSPTTSSGLGEPRDEEHVHELAGDHLIVLTEDGDVVLVKATPERHEEIARFQAIGGKTWNHPVIADGRLLVRNLREMAAFDIRP